MSALLPLLVSCLPCFPCISTSTAPADPRADSPADSSADCFAPAGAGSQQKSRECKKCHGAGRMPCPEHPRAECELEDRVLYCSVIADCPVCAGAGFLTCDICNVEAIRKDLEERRARIQTRRTALKTIDETMGRALRKAETDHYVIVWEMDKIKVEKRWIGPHEALHLYMDRMEAFYADYGARLATKPEEFSRKTWMFVWYLASDHELGSQRFCSQTARGGVKLMGVESRYSVCGNKQHFQNDEALHRNLVHCGTHILLANQTPQQWIGNIKGGWADEGLAHWFEDRYWGICDNYCYQEQDSNVDFKSGKYRFAMRKMIVEGRIPSIADVFQQNVDTLTLPMNAAAFSYVDYLLFRDGAKFKELVKKLKAKVPTREALQEIYGVSPLEFEVQWKAWVLETYPTR